MWSDEYIISRDLFRWANISSKTFDSLVGLPCPGRIDWNADDRSWNDVNAAIQMMYQ